MILVTGATGFIGTNLCLELQRQGRPYRALVRDPGKAEERGLDPGVLVKAELLEGDLAPALEGISSVIHLAGLLRARHEKELFRGNQEGSARLFAALSQSAPTARIILVSSLAAAGPSSDGSGTDCPAAQGKPVSAYGRSKLAGELELVDWPGAWLILRPAIVYGPWDLDVLLFFRMFAKIGMAVLPGPAVRYSLVHVDDVVRAILLAVDSDRSGLYLPLAWSLPVEDREWLQDIAASMAGKSRILRLPRLAGWLGAKFGDLSARVRGKAAFFGRDKYCEFRAGSWVADTRAARKSLGFDARIDSKLGMRRTAKWYVEKQWLRARLRDEEDSE